MKKMILLSAFVTTMTAFAATTGSVSLKSAYSDKYASGATSHDLSNAFLTNDLKLNVSNTFADTSTLTFDGTVDTILNGSANGLTYGDFGAFITKGTSLALTYKTAVTKYGQGTVMAKLSGLTNKKDYYSAVLEGTYNKSFDKGYVKFDSMSEFPIDKLANVKTTNTLTLGLNKDVVEKVNDAHTDLYVKNHYIASDDKSFDQIELVGVKGHLELGLNPTNTLTFDADVNGAIPENDFAVGIDGKVTYVNKDIENNTITAILDLDNSISKDAANTLGTVTPSLELKNEYKGYVNVTADFKQTFVVNTKKEASKTLTLNSDKTPTSTTDLSVDVSKDYTPATNLTVTPGAKVSTSFFVSDLSNVKTATYYKVKSDDNTKFDNNTTLELKPYANLTYKVNNFTATAGLELPFNFGYMKDGSVYSFKYLNFNPKVTAGLAYTW